MPAYSRTNLSALVASRFLNNSTGLITEAQMRQMFNDFIDSTYNNLSDPLPVNYKGGVAGASVPATSALAGDYYDVTSGGTSQGKTWVAGDKATYNGTSGQWTQVTGFFAAADAADIASKAALIEREGLRFDGTAGAVAAGQVLGSSDYTIIGVAKVNALTGTQTIVGSVAGGFTLVVNSSGNLVSSLQGTGTLGTSSGTVTAGVPFFFSVVRSGTTGTFYINGGTSGTFTDTSVYTTGITLLGASTGAVNYLAGSLTSVKPANYALTQSEITALIGRGLVTLPEQRGGSMVSLNTATITNYGGSPYSTFSGASATGFTALAGAGASYAQCNPITVEVKKGRQYRLTYTLSGSNVNVEAALGNLGVVDCAAYQALSAGTANTLTITATASGTVNLGIRSVGAANFTISDISLIHLGTLFEQDSGQRNAGYMVRDTSGNNCDLILPASGVSVIDPAQRGTIRFTTTTSGNQQIGGTQVIIPTNARISSWVINSSGTPNVTLGNVSAGAQYRASAAVVSGDNQITLLTPFTSTGNLWVNSSTTATLKHTLMWEYIQ